MHRITLVFSLLMLFTIQLLNAQNHHEIKVQIKDFQEKELYLAVNYGEKQYLQDTAVVNDAGEFVFAGPDTLKPGIYLVVLPPNNNYLQVLVTDENQKFSLKTDTLDLSLNASFEGSLDNTLFYEYLKFISAKGKEAEPLRKMKEGLKEGDPNFDMAQKKLVEMDKEVTKYQEWLITEHPKTFTAAIVKSNMNIDIPKFEGTQNEQMEKEWRFRQQHHFDNIDLGDQRLLRTPFLFQRVDYFVNKLHVRHPDSMAVAIDYVLAKMKPAPETYRYYVSHFLTMFATSKYVGMDAGYVHMVDKYYRTGEADWVEEEQLKKFIDEADKLKPVLIGKKAQNITLQKKDGTPVTLYDIKTPYTILYFWRYDCPACKKSTPHMKKFYENFKDRGVTLLAVCAKTQDEVPPCWEYIDDNEIGDWLHTVDPYMRSRYNTKYNMRSTPQMFILDENKEIISKGIGAEQLEEVMDKIIKAREQENSENGR